MRITTLSALLSGLLACQLPPAAPATPAALANARITTPAGPSDAAALLAAVADAGMVCAGERHDDPQHHRVQLALLDHLTSGDDPRRLALGLEMFQRRHQPALDDYARGRLDAAQLAAATDWRQSWGFDFAMYEPLLANANQHGLQLVALNAPRELSRALARGGIEALPPEVISSLPEMNVGDADHRRFFWDVMGFGQGGDDPHGHHGGGAALAQERFYVAQVLWDETMAESAASWLETPKRRMLVLAGNGHCHDTAIPARVRRRQPEVKTLSVLQASGDDALPPGTTFDFSIRLPGGD